MARGLGFAIAAVTISGHSPIYAKSDVLSLAGITPEEFPALLRRRGGARALEAAPLVKQASVRKLYPDQIVIDIVERTPAAVWQKDGQVSAIAADGAVIDELRDTRSLDLPFVVGEGANERLGGVSFPARRRAGAAPQDLRRRAWSADGAGTSR